MNRTLSLIKAKLSDRSGEIALRGAVIILISVMLIVAILQVFHIYHTISVVKEKANEAVRATAALNVAGIYQGVRESDWRARQYSDTEWNANVDSSQVIQQLVKSTGGTQTSTDSLLVKDSYTISNLHTTYDNDSSDGLTFTTTLRLDIFFKIGDILNTTIPIDLEITAKYTPKF